MASHDGLRVADTGGRHGLLFTSEGRLNIKAKRYAEDQGRLIRSAVAPYAGATRARIFAI